MWHPQKNTCIYLLSVTSLSHQTNQLRLTYFTYVIPRRRHYTIRDEVRGERIMFWYGGYYICNVYLVSTFETYSIREWCKSSCHCSPRRQRRREVCADRDPRRRSRRSWPLSCSWTTSSADDIPSAINSNISFGDTAGTQRIVDFWEESDWCLLSSDHIARPDSTQQNRFVESGRVVRSDHFQNSTQLNSFVELSRVGQCDRGFRFFFTENQR